MVRNNFRGSKFRRDSIVSADNVIRSLRLTVSARSSSEISTEGRKMDRLSIESCVRHMGGQCSAEGMAIAFWFASVLCLSIFASLVIHGFFGHDTRDSLIEDPVDRGYCQWNTGTCR